MIVYFIGVIVAWLLLMGLNIVIVLDKKYSKEKIMDILDVTLISLFSWLIVVTFLLFLIITYLLED